MALPLNLAMTTPEIEAADTLPEHIAWLSCHFSPFTEGITDAPESLPQGSMLILDDRQRCAAHSPDLVAKQLLDAAELLHCESILLDFQRPFEPESAAMATAITSALPCPVAVTEAFAKNLICPVFLAPCPLGAERGPEGRNSRADTNLGGSKSFGHLPPWAPPSC